MGLLSKLKGGPTIRELAKDAMDLGSQAITDKDKLNDLQYKLAQIQAQSMLTGKGQSVTKITICFLVSLVVTVGAYVFLRGFEYMIAHAFTEESIQIAKTMMGSYKDFAFPASAIIGIITGSYATGSSFKRSKWSKNNGDTE